jgi:hypothetical protein
LPATGRLARARRSDGPGWRIVLRAGAAATRLKSPVGGAFRIGLILSMLIALGGCGGDDCRPACADAHTDVNVDAVTDTVGSIGTDTHVTVSGTRASGNDLGCEHGARRSPRDMPDLRP